MIVIIAIKKLREAAGLSQNDLARLTGYSPQFIQKIEQGKAKSLTLEAAGKFCDALKCKPGDLLEEKPDTDIPESPKPTKKQQKQRKDDQKSSSKGIKQAKISALEKAA